MHFKRNEAFRYQFKQPLQAKIHLEKQNTCDISILDVSPKGMKFNCLVKIPLNLNIQITYKILNKSFKITGSIIWQIDYGEFYQYGALFEKNEEYQLALLTELKKLAKTKPQ
ncbi:hypothetical protein JCM21714_786 [Gracilibacillus boraciitolerans JCM 21714]|uniref:PilZ domain-containing protein n=1 Tax=Gracilibacillus boraciitolerans JCM 21714 TaxID=1298598 RepID=W4VF41_9BACI|nr:PilZ domain-containing protein [Gracilibacillus boraciitolerans]GAE91827.1 hypothetical protein JCM21714_786 [Gracilibacillus boraciitolerans JCM 21714]